MPLYLAKRLLLALFTLLSILALSYLMLRLAPGDPTKSNLLGGDTSPGSELAADKGAFSRASALREKLHLDRPIVTGFAYWLRDAVLRGDFGTSAAVDPGRPVTELILERLPVTVKLNVLAILVTYLASIPLGVFSAVKAGSFFDKSSTFVLFFLYSLPAMWVALMLQSLFCEGGWLAIFPLRGLDPAVPGTPSLWRIWFEHARSYVLPVLTLSYAGFASLSRYARAGMLEVLDAPFIRTARAKGVAEYDVVARHAFRNALITLITLFGGLLPGLVGGSVIVEYVFSIPGMGMLSLLSLSSRDYPLQMALFTFAGGLTLLGVLAADICYMLADPRIKLQK